MISRVTSRQPGDSGEKLCRLAREAVLTPSLRRLYTRKVAPGPLVETEQGSTEVAAKTLCILAL